MRYALGIVLATTLGLGACGSGGGSQIPPVVARPPQPPSPDLVNVDYLGPLAEPAAVWIDGKRMPLESCYAPYSEPLAACVDDSPAAIGELRTGQIVEIHGSRLTTELAANGEVIGQIDVQIKRAIVGPVEAVDADRGWLIVLGQRVYASDSAVASASVGDRVTVYGHFTGEGRIVASLVEPYEGVPLFLLRGVLSEPAAGHLAIGGLEVDISSATRENFPAGTPLAGDAVLVLAHQPPENGILTVETLSCTGKCARVDWTNWEWGSILGFLTGWRSATDFDVDGRTILLTSCDCAYAPPPPLGSFVNVDLRERNGEVTRAISTAHTIGLAGQISAIDAAFEEVVVLGYRVQVSPATQIAEGRSSYFDSSLSFGDLRVGDRVEISGEPLGAGIRAGTLFREGVGNAVTARDYTLGAPAIEIAGRAVLTDGATEVSLCEGGGAMTVDEFFATAWSELGSWLSIALADPYSEPLTAREITVCTPD